MLTKGNSHQGGKRHSGQGSLWLDCGAKVFFLGRWEPVSSDGILGGRRFNDSTDQKGYS